ncbi:MAG: hypothetical protein ABIJ44_03100, partial [Pseudomonadota bacterium]
MIQRIAKKGITQTTQPELCLRSDIGIILFLALSFRLWHYYSDGTGDILVPILLVVHQYLDALFDAFLD